MILVLVLLCFVGDAGDADVVVPGVDAVVFEVFVLICCLCC